MPGKSRRHGKGKHPHHSKKSKAIQHKEAAALQQTAATSVPGQAAAIDTTPLPKVAATPAKTRTLQYPYITGELRRIGILAGIILVILIILAVVLP